MTRHVEAIAVQAPEPAPAPADADRLRWAVTEHYESVWRTLRRLGVPERAVEDAAQHVLIVFARRLGAVRLGSERAFMIGTASRIAADFRKQITRAREDLDPDAIAARPSLLPSVEELIDHGRARKLLDLVLEEMPADLRTVFVLFELEDITMVVIAETLGLPLGTVASRLRRARDAFEKLAARLSTAGRQP